MDSKQEDGEEVGQPGRVLEGMGRVDVEEATPLVPSCLMASMKPTGPSGMVWVTPLRALWMWAGPSRVWIAPLGHEDDAGHGGDGQQDVEHAAHRVDPEVADGGRTLAGEAPDDAESHADADGGGDELLHRQADHLGEVRHGLFAAVVLPVGVGDEGRGRVPGQRRRHGAEMLGIEGQGSLDPQQQVREPDGEAREDDQRAGVALPGLLLVGRCAEQPVDRALDEAQVSGPDPRRRPPCRRPGSASTAPARPGGRRWSRRSPLRTTRA